MTRHKSRNFRATDYLHPRYYPMWLLFGLLRLISWLPYSIQLKIGASLGFVLSLASPKRRRIIDINLSLCFPDFSQQQRKALRRKNYTNLGISLIEIGICWWWPESRLKPLIEIEGLEIVKKYRDQGKGVILLSGHFTSLELGARALALYIPIQVMYRTQNNPLFDSLLYSKRSSYFVNVISRKNTRTLFKGIKNLIPTWYAPDQNFPRERNVFAPFFGIPTATITASARMAKSSNAVMLPYYPERKIDGSGYKLVIEEAIVDFPSDDEVADATAINATIEKFARQHPDQYMWVHKRFKSRPAGEARFY